MIVTNGEIGIGYAKELTIQLITLSTGLVGLSVTFGKELSGGVHPARTGTLKAAWILHLTSIVAGIWTLMALAGTLLGVSGSSVVPDLDAHNLTPAAMQILLFLGGTLLLVVSYSGRVRVKPAPGVYRVIEIADDESGAALGALTLEGWEVVSLASGSSGHWSVVIRR